MRYSFSPKPDMIKFTNALLFLSGLYAFSTINKPVVHETTAIVARTAHSSSVKENPVIPGDFADPSLIRRGNTYYATGTSSEWAPHYPLFTSTDLIHWKPLGYVFNQTPSWASASFWAPELFYRNGTYFVYYVARRKSDGISCIGVATAKDPAKGFTDHGVMLEFGKEAIDPFVIDVDGQLYMTWKAYGLDKRPIEILGSRLSADGMKLEGEPFMLLRDDDKKGIEGQCIVKKGNYFYLLYSLGACCGRGCTYQVEVARATAIQGPYTRFTGNPVLAETDEWKCAGHGTVVTGKDGKDYYLYHAYNKADNVYTGRQGMLSELRWDQQGGWPSLHPMGAKAAAIQNFRDDFTKPALAGDWQWDFRHTKPAWKLSGGNLALSGTPDAKNPTGTALTVRPLSGDYTITTEVANHNESLKGLVLYGDAGQSVSIGIKGTMLQIREVKNNKTTVAHEETVGTTKPLTLKIQVEKGYLCRFFRGDGKGGWTEVKTQGATYNADFLPPWDRSPRPGLLQQGSEPALFSYFSITY